MFNVFCEFVTPELRIKALKKAKEMIHDNGIIILVNDMPDFIRWCKREDCYEIALLSEESGISPWKCKMYIKRNLMEQTSECQVKYTDPNNTKIL